MRVIVVGAGGHARVVLSLLRHYPDAAVMGVADRTVATIGKDVGTSSIITTWEDLPNWRGMGAEATALAIGDNRLRSEMYDAVTAHGFEVMSLRHPTAIIDQSATTGRGTVMCAGAILCAEARVSENVVINSGVIVDHETIVKSHAHIGPGARIAGRVFIGERTFVGIGSSIRDKITIGRDVIIGAGSVVVDDIPDGVVAWGVPATIRRQTSIQKEPE